MTHAPSSESTAYRIDRARLEAALSPATRAWRIDLVEQTGSTNADLLAGLRESGLSATPQVPWVRQAAVQSAGRGQRGRAWVGLPGDSLMFSVACRLPGGPAQLYGLSLATGVAVLDGLQRLPLAAPHRLGLKWPNDVLLDTRKLAGILIESAGGAQATETGVVIGVGLNLRHAAALAARLETSDTAPTNRLAALEDLWPTLDMTTVFAALLDAFAAMIAKFTEFGFTAFRDDWEHLHAFAGKPVRLIERGTEVGYGIAAGVDDLGRLRLHTDGGERLIASGEVSLRPGAA